MKRIGLMIVCVFALLAASAQSTGSIKGKLVDQNGKALAFGTVQVQVGGTAIGANSDEFGKFVIKPLNAGTYNLTASYVGYKNETISGIRVNPDEITILKPLVLAEGDAIKLAKADVTAWVEPLINPEEVSKMSILGVQLETNANLRNPAQLLASFSGEIKISADGRDVSFRGARAGSVVYFLDGVKMTEMPSVPGRGIGSYTVYTGGIPAKYGDTTGGVVIIETKSFIEEYNKRAYN